MPCVVLQSDSRTVLLRFKINLQPEKIEFDNIFGVNASTDEINQRLRPLINLASTKTAFDGFDKPNIIVVTYESSGSGKSHTMYRGENRIVRATVNTLLPVVSTLHMRAIEINSDGRALDRLGTVNHDEKSIESTRLFQVKSMDYFDRVFKHVFDQGRPSSPETIDDFVGEDLEAQLMILTIKCRDKDDRYACGTTSDVFKVQICLSQ